MNDELNPAPLANGHAEGLGPVPVMETIPVPPKKRRKRKAKPAALKVARVSKPRFDPIRDEASKASATNPPILQSASPNEAATETSHCVQGPVADHFIEARERRYDLMFADARSTTAPPIKSTWRQRFVFSLRRVTGIDGAPGEPGSLRVGTAVSAAVIVTSIGALIGVYRVWF